VDFTLNVYKELLAALKNNGYSFQTFEEFIKSPLEKTIILRHDVDARKQNSFEFAKIQKDKNIKSTYYFRIVPKSFDETVIKEMYDMGHEIGYHYETMDTSKGNVDKAYEEFRRHLETFRKIVPINTICMHGSPLSKFDNRDIWKKYDYKKLGLIAEPYFDVDFNKTYYLTDTGRRWDGDKVSVRDKVMSDRPITNNDFLKRKYHTTAQVIHDLQHNNFPPNVMLTFHPQRWTNNLLSWTQELLLQNMKNTLKQHFINA
jgi:hypothetical protein